MSFRGAATTTTNAQDSSPSSLLIRDEGDENILSQLPPPRSDNNNRTGNSENFNGTNTSMQIMEQFFVWLSIIVCLWAVVRFLASF